MNASRRFVEESISPTPFQWKILPFHRGECEFRFFDFSRNCELRFCLKFHHRRYAPAGDRIKISRVGNFCNSKKLEGKFFEFFPIFSKTMGNFGVLSAPVYGHRGALRNGFKKSGISLTLFRQRAPHVFIGIFLKVHSSLIFYY